MKEAAINHLLTNNVSKSIALYEAILKIHEELYGKKSPVSQFQT